MPAGEVGEVQFRGSSVIPGYWRGEGAELAPVSADGWLATGDLGYVDDDGYLFLVDRLKDMIIRNGYNVYPREVEEVLYAHPDVLEAVVVGVPDARIGEEVVALVAAAARAAVRPGGGAGSGCSERVAAYKYPRHVVLVDALPTGPTGKILKREIDRDALARPPCAGLVLHAVGVGRAEPRAVRRGVEPAARGRGVGAAAARPRALAPRLLGRRREVGERLVRGGAVALGRGAPRLGEVRDRGLGVPSTRAARIARAATIASGMPELSPRAPNGANRCAASPTSSTRPLASANSRASTCRNT